MIVNLEIMNLTQMGRESQFHSFLGVGGFRKSISNSWFQCSWTEQVKTKHLIVFIKILGQNYITKESAIAVKNCYSEIFCQLY